ncbi:carboxypeptidase inhibitor SmCI-like [Haliotis cracherodii]|uniref:carboxypeptidase inhibitor SmCI-like n=1 Tax=Haliotis cracherodii TaxID=6455 RepID=UPI0039EAD8FD
MNPRLALTLVVLCFLGTAIVEAYDCNAAPVRRPCTSDSDKERVFFNTTTQKCDTFDWRTCTTGDNSFSDWDSCTHACVCPLPAASTPCVFGPGVYHGNYFFNTDANKCATFPAGHQGCSQNQNAFESESSCKMSCVCSMPRDRGSCSGKDKAYYFNEASKQCEEFTYSGCGGNANRFASEEECKEQCLCGLPPRTGRISCMAYMPRVFYNKTSQTCENFIYGGCAGTNNRFYSMEDCNAACP